MNDSVRCRLILPQDVEPTVALMSRVRVHFAGSRSHNVLRAVARDGVQIPSEVIIALATTTDDVPCGIVVAFAHRARYWRRFAVRHPLAALGIGFHRLVRHVPSRSGGITEIPLAEDAKQIVADRLVPQAQESWADESGNIAKVMFIAVDESTRKKGIGVALYAWFFEQLKRTGLVRCDAHVSAANVPALKLHRQFPFRFVEVRGGYFLWMPIQDIEPR